MWLQWDEKIVVTCHVNSIALARAHGISYQNECQTDTVITSLYPQISDGMRQKQALNQ